MATDEILKTLITVIIAALGWVVAHYFSSKRDRRIKRREIKTAHLIKAYTILANDITERAETSERNAKLELLISELQLFGSNKQIALTKELAENIQHGGEFNFDELLKDIRNDLRKELELNPIQGRVKWLRFNKDIYK
jgi:hypothetical protein